MKIIITGATGLIGKALYDYLKSSCEIIALSRNVEKAKLLLRDEIKIVQWDGEKIGHWAQEFEGAFCIINLAGENIEGRWTQKKKDSIRRSRLNSTSAVVQAIRQTHNKPNLLIQASAMGYYGSRNVIEADENSPNGEGFLAQLCVDWEKLIEPVPKMGIRCVILRTCAVLSTEAGLLKKMMFPFRFFMGGYLGSGEQWVSWININDVCRAVKFLIDNEKCEGPFNITSPNPVQLKEFCSVLGKVMKRPCWTALPACAAKIIYGELTGELLLASYKIWPKKILNAGFEFKYPELTTSLQYLIKGSIKWD